MKLSLILLLLLVFPEVIFSFPGNIKTGTQRIEKFVNEQGFFQNTITDITSDNFGYLWVATPNGLIRYDGYSFEYFYHDNENQESIPNNYITHLLKDSNGKLWKPTKQELYLYLADKESDNVDFSKPISNDQNNHWMQNFLLKARLRRNSSYSSKKNTNFR